MKSIKQYSFRGCSVGITDRWIYKVCRWDHLRSHDDRLRQSCNIRDITSTIWEAAMLVFMISGIYGMYRWDSIRRRNMYANFHDYRLRNSSNIKVITSEILEVSMLVLLIGRIYEVRRWDGLRWHDIHTPSLMRIDFCIQQILKFCLSNSRRCNVGISNGRKDLWS
jgi:hypothetical protein